LSRLIEAARPRAAAVTAERARRRAH